MASKHPTVTTPFVERAEKATHPLSAYLLRLMDLKASNLCLSADVATARELLYLADKVGPSIVVLKTHYDLVAGWDYNPQTGTGAKLAALARKHGFLLFEDRKFNDIGKTVQMQYTAGTARIVDWAHIVNMNMASGPDGVAALAQAAAKWRERINYEVRTSVTVGTPISDSFDEYDESALPAESTPTTSANSSSSAAFPTSSSFSASNNNLNGTNNLGAAANAATSTTQAPRRESREALPYTSYTRDVDGRKGSIVSVTTVTQHFEPADSPRLSKSMGGGSDDDVVFQGIEEAPLERGLLLLAQMSTRGNLMTPEYTAACVAAAREHRQFVMGFVSQESLNSAPDDAFIHMTPGCQLPPPGEEENGVAPGGDGLGQQYNTPAKLVGLCGTDIVIVGRGIISAGDPPSEAERYRRRAWKAYLSRLS